jgi:hypothetical protein
LVCDATSAGTSPSHKSTNDPSRFWARRASAAIEDTSPTIDRSGSGRWRWF